jgi:hypothetical protein
MTWFDMYERVLAPLGAAAAVAVVLLASAVRPAPAGAEPPPETPGLSAHTATQALSPPGS